MPVHLVAPSRGQPMTSYVTLKGGTDAEMAPPIDYLVHVLTPTLRRLFALGDLQVCAGSSSATAPWGWPIATGHGSCPHAHLEAPAVWPGGLTGASMAWCVCVSFYYYQGYLGYCRGHPRLPTLILTPTLRRLMSHRAQVRAVWNATVEGKGDAPRGVGQEIPPSGAKRCSYQREGFRNMQTSPLAFSITSTLPHPNPYA